MAVQSNVYPASNTRVYLSSKHIGSKSLVRVFTLDSEQGDWEILSQDFYELINNSIVLKEVYDGYQIEVRVADTEDELTNNQSEISIIASNIENINTVASIDEEVSIVANRNNDIIVVANRDSDIADVQDNIGDIQITANNISNVNTVSGSIGNVNLTGSNISNVNIVGSNINDVNTVSGSISNVNLTGSNISNVNIVGSNINNVNTVGLNSDNVTTVANNVSNINTVAGDTVQINEIYNNRIEIYQAATIATTKASEAAASALSASNDLATFQGQYTSSATEPTGSNEGDLWFDESTDIMKVYNGSSWQSAGSSINGTSSRNTYTATQGQTTFNSNYDVGFVDVYLNGIKLHDTVDFTATNGSSVVLVSGVNSGDIVDIVAYGTFQIADVYTQSQADALLDDKVSKTGNETIAGVKTFTSSPVVPTPTTDMQSATKKYVDDNKEATWVANDNRAKTALNASGTAPVYACRAWVNFNGIDTVAIRASGNVSSITDNGIGDYTVNFATAMPDGEATLSGVTTLNSSGNLAVLVPYNYPGSSTSTSFRLQTRNLNGALQDCYTVNAVFHR